jgi:2-aminoethylphosphonate-pyruvate transaminase
MNTQPNTDKRLFTPGPLTTSATVKQAMLRDPGSRDPEFIKLVQDIRTKLLGLAGVSQETGYETIPMQGSGTFGIEAVISSVIPRDGKLLVIINGAYGERIVEMARRHAIQFTSLRAEENQYPDLDALDQALTDDAAISHVAAIHCETTTGIVNPAEKIGQIVKRHKRTYIVDAMSSFGAIPLDLGTAGVDFLISSANKCIQGVPGFAFIIAKRESLLATEGQARTLSLDLLGQWQGLEKNGQFRFTPPTHTLLAFAQALAELESEGGVAGRAQRYEKNHSLLVRGMAEMGFRTYLPAQDQGCIITTFHYPTDPKFDFKQFYQHLADRGFLIYPGKLTKTDCFRIGNIGDIHEADIKDLLEAVRQALEEMDVAVS